MGSQPRQDLDSPTARPDDGVSIAEAARLSGVSVHTLRYYERSGMMPTTPMRTSGGTRRYGSAELEWIHTCKKLRSLGMSTDLIRRYVDLVRAGPGNEGPTVCTCSRHSASACWLSKPSCRWTWR